ncbi:MAG: transposase [Patescibacteria group bacterium]
MKNRDYKSFAAGTISHVYNRGNNKEKIFLDEQDYKSFLMRLGLGLGIQESELQKEFFLPYSRIRITGAKKNDFVLHAFCLMPNHFHLLIEQKKSIPISTLMLKVCTSYAKYFNKKYSRIGHVFQDQFKSVLIDSNEQLMWISVYIHGNPAKDGLVNLPHEHKWSSYNDFVKGRKSSLVNTEFLNSIIGEKNFEKETLTYVKGDL